eukprot:365963-Chlamydomonas_euryale.AAC.2
MVSSAAREGRIRHASNVRDPPPGAESDVSLRQGGRLGGAVRLRCEAHKRSPPPEAESNVALRQACPVGWRSGGECGKVGGAVSRCGGAHSPCAEFELALRQACPVVRRSGRVGGPGTGAGQAEEWESGRTGDRGWASRRVGEWEDQGQGLGKQRCGTHHTKRDGLSRRGGILDNLPGPLPVFPQTGVSRVFPHPFCTLPRHPTLSSSSPQTFCAYCLFTRGVSRKAMSDSAPSMVGQQLHKLATDVGLTAGPGAPLSAAAVDLAAARVRPPGGSRRLSFQQWLRVLCILSDRSGVDVFAKCAQLAGQLGTKVRGEEA